MGKSFRFDEDDYFENRDSKGKHKDRRMNRKSAKEQEFAALVVTADDLIPPNNVVDMPDRFSYDFQTARKVRKAA